MSKLSTYANVTFSNVIFLFSFLNSFEPFLISGDSFLSENILLNDAIAL